MKKFVVFDGEGTIIRYGACVDEMVKLQAKEGQFVMEGDGNDIEHKVVKGKIVKKNSGETNGSNYY